MPRWDLVRGLLYGGVVVAWGLNYVFVRWGLAYTAPLWLAVGRALLGTAGVAVFLLATRRTGVLDRRGRRDAALIGVPATAVFFGLWFMAASTVPAGQAAVTVYTYPFWVAILSAWVIRYPLRRTEILAIVVGFSGVVLVSEPWAHGAGAPPPIAIAELLLGSFAWALGTVAFKQRFTGPEVQEANLYQLLGGSAALLVAAVAFAPHGFGTAPQLVPILAWLGIIGTAFGYGAWYYLLDRFPAVSLSTYLFLVPVVALTASIVLLGERLSVVQVLGVALVLVSIYATARTDAGANSRSSAPPATPVPGTTGR